MLLETVQPVREKQSAGWDIDAVKVWRQAPGKPSRATRGSRDHSDHDDNHEPSTVDTYYDFEDLDIREFDGDEPEMAELVLAGEESDMMNLDATRHPLSAAWKTRTCCTMRVRQDSTTRARKTS